MPALDPSQNQIVLAMDHARALGAVKGLEDPGRTLETCIDAGVDAIMTSFGVVKHYRERLIGRVPTFLRLDGGPAIVSEKWLENTRWSLLHTVEDAHALGCDGVCLMYFMGAPCEMATLEIVAEVCGECLADGFPVMVEALPCPNPNIKDTYDAQMMADACRIAFEHGADILKTYWTGSVESFRKVTAATPAPTLVAGGPRLDSDLKLLEMLHGIMQAGGKGIVMGRNIWQAPDPAAMVRAMRAVIHEGATGAQAHEVLKRAA
jgi:DhnA family fructose-bisphosphate aldolase class Ia